MASASISNTKCNDTIEEQSLPAFNGEETILKEPLVTSEVSEVEMESHAKVEDADPLSCRPPKGFEPQFFRNEIMLCNVEGGSGLYKISQFTYAQRKENWLIRSLLRPSGIRTDTTYIHLREGTKFRSLSAVYKFVVHGLLPLKQGGEKSENSDNGAAGSSSRKFKGHKMIRSIPVGYYNHTTGLLYRPERPQEDGTLESLYQILVGVGNNKLEREDGDKQASNSDTGNNKRKREDGDEGPSNSTTGIEQQFVLLHDFEPTQ